ncbi:hypothetical protein ACROYT_G024079 [Oculina patagonica]
MDPRDVPNHSPAHTHSFFDGNSGHPNTVLRSPPLSHDPTYGMHPSAFSMMGRRPGLPDFRGSLDPILGSQSSLTSPGALHGPLTGGPGSAGWWMPPHPHAHGITPEYFTSHITGSWLSHEHDCALANHERLEECLYPSARSRGSLMNGVNSSSVFGSGSGIFYPPPSSPQSMHGFVHQASPTTSSSKSGLSHWSSHGNHDGKGILDLGDGRDLDMIPRLNRKLSNCSEESNDRDSEMRPSDVPLHHKERTKDAKIERTKATNNISEKTDARSGNKLQPEKNSDNNSSNSQRKMDLSVHSQNSNVPTQQNSLSEKKNESKSTARISEENYTSSVSEPSKSLPTPPKLQKVKSGPPPRLQVPTSILNKTEGIVPTKPEPHVKAGKEISSLLREEMLKPTKKVVTNSVKAKQAQSKADTMESLVSSEVQSKSKSALSEQKLASTSKALPSVEKLTPGTAPKQPKIPSGKPPLIAHFRDVKYNEDSSDDDSDSSNVSSGSESGSGSDDESEEGEEGENEEDTSGSDTDSDGSDEEEDGGEQHDDDDEEEDEDDVAMETQESGVSFEETSHSSGKRKMDQTSSGTPRKRCRAVDEEAVKIPLAKGWRRQTRLRQVGPSGGLRGDVYYFAPCGKKLRTYPEVTRYLTKNGITDVTQENFSFSTKLHIGEFLECREGSVFEPLPEEEVNRRKQEDEEKNRAKMEKLNKKQEKKQKQAEMVQKAMEAKLVRKAQRQAAMDAAKMAKREREMAQKAAAAKRLEKVQREAALEAVKMAKRERAEARMRNKAMKREAIQAAREAKKERVRMLAEQKRLAKERAREQRQMARRKKKEDAANAKYEDAMKKAKERELKRQQSVLLKQQEKEQKKQQQMMIRAIESQRKQEERERLKEEKKMEKKLLREKKLEQKRREMILARELKKPVEDMVLKDSKALPELTRVKGLEIPGGAFADLLMVQEFVHNFGEALDLDSSEIPSLWEMQSSLLNDSSEDVLVPLCQSLLISALEDPGCEGPNAFTTLGVALAKVELNESNFSEVLRLFVLARNAGDPHPLSDALSSTPFQALTMSDKAGVMAYICNELLCSRTICREIESSIEHMSNLRREKWVVEGKIRKLKAIQAEKYPVVKVKKPPGRPRADVNIPDPEGENSNSIADDSMQGNEDDEEEEEEEEEDEDDDDDDDGEGGGDGTQSSDESEEEDDAGEPTTQEELERRLKKFEKKHTKFRSKLFGSSHALRALCLGQDRYKRRYWILPHGGGIFAEGMETAEKEIVLDLKPEGEAINHSEVKHENMEVDGVKQVQKIEPSKDGGVQESGKETVIKSPTALKSPLKSPVHLSSESVLKPDNNTVIAPSGDNKVEVNNHHGNVQTQANTCISTAASRNALEIQRIENLFKSEPSTSKPSPSLQKRSNVQQTQGGGSWFSLLPRMPCDESSLTLSHTHNSGNFVPTYSKRGDTDIMSTPPLKRPPGRPPRISNPSYDSTNHQAGPSTLSQELAQQATTIQFLPQLPVKRPPGRPPKSSYQTLNLVYLDGNPGGNMPTSTLALSTQSASTMSLSFEELKRNVLESLMQEPAPIPPELQHGWWRITEPSQLKELVKILHSRGIREKILQKNFQKYSEYANSSCTKGDQVESDSDDDEETPVESAGTEKNKDNPIEDKMFPEVAFAVNKAILREVEEMEEKVFTASLQVKGWRLPAKASKGLSHNSMSETNPSSENNPLAIAITRLLALEQAIERRYLKHPLRNDKLHIPSNIGTAAAPGEVPSGEDGQPKEAEKMEVGEEMMTPALKIWRNAVVTSQSASQLSMCLFMLYDCVAWEKSIMKVFCQICRKGDNEELLLLCDGCDRGYHTYCCTPKLSSIPEGDWYCTDCIVLAAGGDNCCMCGGASGKMAKCDNCPRNFHLQCLEPPLSKLPRASWTCPNCKRKRSKPRKKRRIKEDDDEPDDSRPLTPPPKEEVRPHANRKQASKDMAPCRMILAEMEKHEDAWPFLVPVNPKQFPEYYKIIRRPMDFHTMKIKLRDCQYPGPADFTTQRLVKLANDFCNSSSDAGRNLLPWTKGGREGLRR